MNDGLLNNREVASLVLLGVLLTVVLLAARKKGGLSRSLGSVIFSFLHPKIFVPLTLYAGWVLAALIPASILGVWEPTLWVTTVTWLLLAGIRLLFKFSDVIEEPGFFKLALTRLVQSAVIVEFVANLASFALWLELLLQALALVFVMVSAVASSEPEHAQVSKLATGYFVAYGFAAAIWGLSKLVSDWSEFDHGDLLREFLLPIWLTPVALVYVYALAVYASYETAIVQIRLASKGRGLVKQRLAMILRTAGRPERLRILGRTGAWRFAHTSGFRDAWNEVGQIIDDHGQRIAAKKAKQFRPFEDTGAISVDSDGKRLDQREHSETMEAMRWLSTCQMGHFQNTGRYQKESLAPVVVNLSEKYGLPTPNGVCVHVSGDGQQWYAERQTITGHWFAIGAAGPPSDQWFYDGADPPSGYPDDSEWDQWMGDNHAVNWL